VKPLIRYESEESSQDQSLPADFDTAEYILTGKSGVPDFRSEAGDSDTGSKQGTESVYVSSALDKICESDLVTTAECHLDFIG